MNELNRKRLRLALIVGLVSTALTAALAVAVIAANFFASRI
jgi:hypothetical protein